MNLVPQVETAEISDADLDQVSGGQIGIDAGAAVITVGGTAGAGLYAEAGPLAVNGGLGASVTPGGAAEGHARTTSF
ncbi:hypothetical protein [Streptomyces sp. WG7]|uniref:hypothetical protein n=1 Tax=Streptomyces sp. WG7 TaxID=3417650 RepID=UPI003CE7C837